MLRSFKRWKNLVHLRIFRRHLHSDKLHADSALSHYSLDSQI